MDGRDSGGGPSPDLRSPSESASITRNAPPPSMSRVQRAKPSAGLVARGAAKISWYAERLDTSGDVQVLHTACSPGPCDVTLPLVSDGSYSIAHAWETSGNVEITRSVRPQFVAVP